MRARNIKPGFFTNEDLVECEPLARILFAGLWCIADRDGRLEDRPRKIKLEILPADDCNVEVLLDQLKSRNFIARYEVDGRRCIQILKFDEHQNPHPKEKTENIPPPPAITLVSQQPLKAEELHGQKFNSGLNPSSLLLESLNPESSDANASPPPRKKSGKPPPNYTPQFDELWQVYPRKEKKLEAFEAYNNLISEGITHETLIDGARRYAAHCQRNRTEQRYIALAASWLNARRYDDHYAVTNGHAAEFKSDWTSAVEQILAEDRASFPTGG
jgi:hypothetical protein